MTLLSNILHGRDANEEARNRWLAQSLAVVPTGLRILDAGAGELRSKPLCSHLDYVSQDFCQYEGTGDALGLQTGRWDTSRIDLVCDIQNIPEPGASFDVVMRSEVFEHLPDLLKALDEFERLPKPGGKLIVIAPFASLVHFAPCNYASGFGRYWHEYHLPKKNFEILELSANGHWFAYVRREILRLPSTARKYGDRLWPLAYLLAWAARLYFFLRKKSQRSEDLARFGRHWVAVKQTVS